MSIEVANESGMDVDETILIDVAAYVMQRMDVHPAAELAITLVDLATIEQLHVQWLDLPGPTARRSRPLDERNRGASQDSIHTGPAIVGDIVYCPQFAADQAKRAGHGSGHEMALLTVHGVLHLLGYDHATAAEEQEMFSLQNALLAEWYDQRDMGVRKV